MSSFSPTLCLLLPAAALLLSCAHAGGPRPAASAAPRTVSVQVLALNDFHGNLAPPSGSSGELRVGSNPDGSPARVKAGGISHLAHHLARLRATAPKNT